MRLFYIDTRLLNEPVVTEVVSLTDNKTVPSTDPYAAREATKYDKPIPSREYILELLAAEEQPLTRDAILDLLGLEDEEQQEALRRRLIAMVRDGQLIQNRRQAYGVIDKMDLIRGRVIGHPDGFGFVATEEGGDDLYLHAKQMRQVFDGDQVLVHVVGLDQRGRREAAIVRVLERAHSQLVGRYYQDDDNIATLVPDNRRINQDILIAPESQDESLHGQIVSVSIVSHPTRRSQAIGKVVEVLGAHMAPGMEIDIAVRNYGLPYQFTPEVEAEVAGLSPEVTEAEKQGRKDLRHLPLVTIDGEDARDFDDAVYCEPKRFGGWRLYVAIADVSHYVRPGTELDKSAYERGNSVYFPEQVIPMLPEVLSNGLCSLNPEVDRLCMVCEMQISRHGRLSRYKFYPAVMHSKARLTYTQVAAMLQGDEAVAERYAHVLPHIQSLSKLYQALLRRREQRGAIDFDTVETRIVFGEQRKIEQIVPVVRNDAHRIIEECMLCANVAAARLLRKHKAVGIFRNHEPPTETKLETVRSFLGPLGLSLGGGDEPSSSDYAALSKQVLARPDGHVLQMVLLRSLQQAVYSPENKGHFGLAYKEYTHFTSPIRRYPDLMVHRTIRQIVAKSTPGAAAYSEAEAAQLGEQCSMTERRADDATRDAVAWLKCEYMQNHLGDEFQGVIAAVTSFGFFVELDAVYVEGLVHVSSLSNDYYHYDPERQRLVGERGGQHYKLGDSVQVRVAKVDLDDRKMDFELVTGQKAKPKAKGRQHAKARMTQEALAAKRKAPAKKSGNKSQSSRGQRGRKARGG